jgi:hypothetical protein
MIAVQLPITYETLVEMVEQLPREQQLDLMRRLQARAFLQPLTSEEKLKLLRTAQVDVTVNQEPSPRREDWYGDDGR